jgi:hypothetical protein
MAALLDEAAFGLDGESIDDVVPVLDDFGALFDGGGWGPSSFWR